MGCSVGMATAPISPGESWLPGSKIISWNAAGIPGSLKAQSRCSKPQVPDPAPYLPAFSRRKLPRAPATHSPGQGGDCYNGRKRFLSNFYAVSQFPEDLPCLLLLVSPPVSSLRNTRGAAEWEVGFMAWLSVGDFSPSCLLLFHPSSSAGPQRANKDGRVSVAHGGWRLMTALGVSPCPWRCWGWRGFLQRPCPAAHPLPGRS